MDELTLSIETLRATMRYELPSITGSLAPGWFIFELPDGGTVIAPSLEDAMSLTPPRVLGWEGHGAQFRDGAEPEAEVAAAIKRVAVANRAREDGKQLSAAIGALHGQRRPDGRPMVYLPEETL